jgi:hypothetical protein
MHRFRRTLLAVGYVFLPIGFGAIACVGDDPAASNGAENDAGNETGSSNNDGAPPGSEGGTGGDATPGTDSGTGTDTGVDAGPRCGYPGEDCCGGGALACREGTICGTSNQKCMVSEVGIVGEYADIQPGPTFTSRVVSAFYDGSTWAIGPEVISEGGFTTFSPTDLIAGSPGNYRVTLFKSAEGKMFNRSGAAWQKCEPGQSCVGPLLPPPAFWSVAFIGNDTWIGATNAIYRCVQGAGCPKEVTGLESTTWGTGKLVGTATQDIWYSALSRAFHFDGTKWTIHDNIKARTIFEVRKDDVWVGDKTLQHYDGTNWSTEFAINGNPAPGLITSISGSSSKDIWAVGYDGSANGHPVFTAHWDGVSWTLKAVPAELAEAPTVYAPSPLEAFLACSTGVYRWDGSAWQKMTMPTVDAGQGGQPSWSYIAGPAKPRQ